MSEWKPPKRGYLVWIDEDKIDEVVEILADDQVCVNDATQYDAYEQLINYFQQLKKQGLAIATKRTRR